MADNKQLAESLRKVASELRKEADEIEKENTIKCAQVLIAANGLSHLRKIMRGEN